MVVIHLVFSTSHLLVEQRCRGLQNLPRKSRSASHLPFVFEIAGNVTSG